MTRVPGDIAVYQSCQVGGTQLGGEVLPETGSGEGGNFIIECRLT